MQATHRGFAVSETADLIELLRPQPLGDSVFRGLAALTPPRRAFGGQTLAQAAWAAGDTVEPMNRALHHLSAQFLRAPDPEQPIDYAVDSVSDGRMFSGRVVRASQKGRLLAVVDLAFAAVGEGAEHQSSHLVGQPIQPAPPTAARSLESWLSEFPGRRANWWSLPQAVELRYLQPPPTVEAVAGRRSTGMCRLWLCTREPLPEDPLIHAAVAVWASDLTPFDAVARIHGVSVGDSRCVLTSINHHIWFHGRPRFDGWFTQAQECPVAAEGRALTFTQWYDPSGRLVASYAQEGLVQDLESAERDT